MAATRWLTFDCYGTIADWNSCMLSALEPVAGAQADGAARRLPPGRVHPRGRAAVAPVPGDPHRRARAGGAAQRGGACRPGPRARWSTAWPGMEIFPDVAEALADLVRSGWRLGVLTNCDDDLFASTAAKLPAPVEVVVTAQQVRSYKPDLAHFRKFAELTGATPGELDPRRQQLGARHPAGRRGWGCARSGWTATAPGTRPSSPSGGSPRCAACRRRCSTSACCPPGRCRRVGDN